MNCEGPSGSAGPGGLERKVGEAHAMPVGVAHEERMVSTISDRESGLDEPALPGRKVSYGEGQHVSRAGLGTIAAKLLLEHQHEGPRLEPGRPQAAIRLVEPPLLGKPEKACIESERTLHVGHAKRQVMDGTDRLAFGHAAYLR